MTDSSHAQDCPLMTPPPRDGPYTTHNPSHVLADLWLVLKPADRGMRIRTRIRCTLTRDPWRVAKPLHFPTSD